MVLAVGGTAARGVYAAAGGAAGLAGFGRGGGDGGGGGGGHIVAAQVEQGLGGQLVADDTKAGVRGVGRGVLEGVPPDVVLAEEGAADVLPESLGVLDRGHRLADRLAADGVPGLRDPDGLATAGLGGLAEGVGKQRVALADGVGHGVLEVRVGVHAQPVDGVDNGLVRAVVPGSPGLDVADLGILERGTGDGVPRLLDVTCDGVRLGTDVRSRLDAHGRVAVEILGADRDAVDEAAELLAVLLDGRLEGRDLV